MGVLPHRRGRSGIAGIVAGLILFVILFTVGTGYFLWVNTNDQSYINALANRNNEVQAQQGESISLTAFANVASGWLMFTPTNTGSEPVNITTIIITDTSGNPIIPGGGPEPVSITINSGVTGSPVQTEVQYCPTSTTCSHETLVIKVVTQRGSVFSVIYTPPAITTNLSSEGIIAGQSITDSATLTGITPNANGTVSFYWFAGANSCPTSGTGPNLAGTTAISKGGPTSFTSDSVTFPNVGTGTYSWDAVYSGDPINPMAVSPCEQLTVGEATPSVTTSLSPASPILVGTSVTDTATLLGATSNAGGTVQYEYFSGDSCAGAPNDVGAPVTVTDGVVPHSPAQQFNTVGSYSWLAVYSGDSNNVGPVTSPCDSEELVVNQATPVLTTSFTPRSTVVAGTTADPTLVTDTATLTDAASSATGTVTFYDGFTGIDPTTGYCVGAFTGGGTELSSSPVSGDSATSTSVTENTPGVFYWDAYYSGDTNNAASTSPCETLVVQYATSLRTSLSASSIVLGGSVIDTATLTGNGTNAGGTVSFYYSTDTSCPTTSPTQVGGPGTTYPLISTPTGTNATSDSVIFNSQDVYYWYAVYTGDTYNAGSTSPCEPLTVGLGLTTTLSAPTITLGSKVTDTATLQYATGTSGSVTFYYFTESSTCATGTGTAEGTTPIVNGEPSSISSSTITPAAAGSFSWDAVYTVENYPAQGENTPIQSPCEQFSVLAPNGANVGSLSEVLGSFKFYFAEPYCNSILNSSSTPDCLGDGVLAGGYYGYGVTLATAGSDCSSGFGFFGRGEEGSSSCIPVVFSLVLTNTDPFRSITLGSQSFLWLDGTCQTYNSEEFFFVEGHCSGTDPFSAPLSQGYWIVNGSVTSGGSGAVPLPYDDPAEGTSPVTIPPGGQATLYFYCGGPCTTESALEPPSTNPPPGTYVEASLSLYGIYSDGTPFGQSIPFIASYISPVEIQGCAIGTSYTGTTNCWTANTPNLAAAPQTFITLGVDDFPCTAVIPGTGGGFFGTGSSCSSSDSFPIYAYWVNSTGGVTQIASNPDCVYANQVSGGSPGYCTITFQVPAYAVPGQTYSMYVTSDGVNNAYATVTITGGTTTVVTCTPSSITLGGPSSSCEVTVTGTSPSPPTGTVTWSATPSGSVTFSSTTCTLSPSGTCSVTVTGKVTGTTTITGAYGGDDVNEGSSGTSVLTIGKASPTISTVLSHSTITIGSSVTDTATLSGASGPTGSVTFTVYSDAACTAQVFTSTGTIRGSSATSGSFTPASIGTYYWEASYTGDANNNGFTTTCGVTGETLTVNVASPTISTVLSHSTITIGSSVTDTATLSGAYGIAGESVTFTVYSDAACTAQVFTSTNTITGSSATSGSFTPTALGTYYWQASYAGDSNNNPYTTTCGAGGETLTVNKATPSITTTVSSGGTITIGGSATDQGTFAGAYPTLTGSLVFRAYTSSSCGGTASFTSSTVTVSGNGPYTSNFFTPSSTGTYYWQATFTDTDGNNNGFTSPCGGTGETLTVNKASPTLATILTPAATVDVGTSVTDTASLSGETLTASGSVTYSYYTGSSCSGSGTSNTVTVTAGSVPNSTPHTFNTAGLYSYRATYSGDTNNNAATSACEPLSVLSLTISPTSVPNTGGTGSRTVTLSTTSAGYSTTTTYSYCLSSSATSESCVGGTAGAFSGFGATGTIPTGTTLTVPTGQPTGTYYVIVYTGTTILITATLTVT